MTSERSERILQLDGLRGLAITAVFIHHAYHAKLLWMGVDLFFVLSGFLITGILLKTKERAFRKYIGGFYARRARRILPPYITVLVITVGIFGTAWINHWWLYLGGMNFFHPLGFSTPDTLPLWSLAVEEQFYLLWPIAVFYMSRKHLRTCAVILMVAAPVLRYFCTPLFHSHWAIYMLLPFRMDTLAAGALIAIIWPEVKDKVSNSQLTISSLCMIALSLVAIIVMARHGFTTYSDTAIGNLGVYESTLVIVTSVFLMSLAGVGRRFFVFPPLMWLGYISYSVYLIHLTVLNFDPYHSIALAAAITIAYASAMWIFVERPILSWKRNPS